MDYSEKREEFLKQLQSLKPFCADVVAYSRIGMEEDAPANLTAQGLYNKVEQFAADVFLPAYFEQERDGHDIKTGRVPLGHLRSCI